MVSSVADAAAHRRLQSFWPKSFQLRRWGYSRANLAADLLAGLTVGIVALPLALAFAIGAGLPPERGLYTAIVAGFVVSLLSGSRYQIGGPTGAFIVIISDVVLRHGYAGLQVATLMAAAMMVLMGLARLGTMIKFIPYPVVIGFTSGIAVVIFSSQVKDFFGLRMEPVAAHFFEKWSAYAANAHQFNGVALVIAASSLALILGLRRMVPRWPGAIFAVGLSSAAVWAWELPVETISSRFGEISGTLPLPALPDVGVLGLRELRELLPDAFTIAFLAAVESLLCAVVADGMTGDRHNSNTELVGQGAANVASILFGGIPATGALARTATNIKAGAHSPVAGMVHAGTLCVITLVAAPLAGRIPLATLAAILAVVAWDMSEARHFVHMFRGPRSDWLVMLTTFALTVVVDLTLAVEVGIVLAAFLFMRRMVEVTEIGDMRLTGAERRASTDRSDRDSIEPSDIPAEVSVYEIDGPFFFGVTDRLKGVLSAIDRPPKVFILRMRRVPAIDATGLNALEDLAASCLANGTQLVLSGIHDQPLRALRKIGLEETIGAGNIFTRIGGALEHARHLTQREPDSAC